MRKISIITLSFIATSLLLAGCGEESGSVVGIGDSPAIGSPSSNLTPNNVNKPNSVSLNNIEASNTLQSQKVKGEIKLEKAIVDAEFSNATGEFTYKELTTAVTGNISFVVNVSEPDQIADISLFLPDYNKSIALCESDCGTSFNKTITGFNPQLSGVNAGDLRIELFVTDNQQNSAILDALTLNWQPINISAVNLTRENGVITIDWDGESSLNRYNVYAATEPNLTPNNATTLDNGWQQLAITSTNVTLTDQAPTKNYYVIITGINESGESGKAAPYKIPSALLIQNQAPFARADTITVFEDSFITANIVSNDVDPENAPLSINAIITQPSHGTLIELNDQEITYTPNPNFNGKDSFTYQIIDDENNTAQANVSININNVNDDPIAERDTFNLDTNNSFTSDIGALLANDFDPDGDLLFVEIAPITEPLSGILQLNSDGSFTFTDDGTFLGSDSFEYQVTDNQGGSSINKVLLFDANTVISPGANNDTYVIDEDTTLTTTLANGILSNDFDANNLNISLVTPLITSTTNGTLNLNENGTFTYLPKTNYSGIDSFQYEIENTLGETSQAFVSIKVNSVTDAPVAVNDSYQMNEDSLFSVDSSLGLLANDTHGESGNLTINTTPIVGVEHGILTLYPSGSFSYTPEGNYHGVVTFTYQLISTNGLTSSAQVTLTITPENDAPKTANDFRSTTSEINLVISPLTNDSDVDGDALSLVPASTTVNASYGTLTTIGNNIVYLPDPAFKGLAEIVYTTSDNQAAVGTGSVFISVLEAGSSNQNPTASDITFAIAEGEDIQGFDLLGNVTDPDGDNTRVIASPVIDVSNGTLAIVSNGTFTYTPKTNFSGTDSFVYRAIDDNGGFADATVTITVVPVNNAPEQHDDSYVMVKNTSLTVTSSDFNALLANDVDVDGDVLYVNPQAIQQPYWGNLTLSQDGEFTYTPNPGYSGDDQFTYELLDGNGGAVNSNVFITILNVNSAPTSNSDSYDMFEGETLQATSVLNNDTDADDDILTIDTTFASLPANGTVVFNTDGTFAYTPNANFVGVDSFAYKAVDVNGASDEGLVTINIVLDPASFGSPLAITDNYSVDEDATLIINSLQSNLVSNDTTDQLNPNDLSLLVVATVPERAPSHGVVTLQANGNFTYTPNTNYYGSDLFEYRVKNNYGNVSTGTVIININSINDSPVAFDDVVHVIGNSGTYQGDFLLNNDSDPENDHIEVNQTPVTNVTSGLLTLAKHGDFTYTPDTNFVGQDSFVYELSDTHGDTDIATVNITVTAATQSNAAPIATDDMYTVPENTPLTVNVSAFDSILTNDTDPEGDVITLDTSFNSVAANGTVSLLANSSFTYTPNNGFSGTDSFTYQITDGNGNQDQGLVSITVVADSSSQGNPLARNNAYLIGEDSSLVSQEYPVNFADQTSILNNDTTNSLNLLDQSPLTLTLTPVQQPNNGTVTLQGDGTFTYIPNTNFFGTDTFDYEVTNIYNKKDTARVSIIVFNVADVPIAADDSFSVNKNSGKFEANFILNNDYDPDGNQIELNETPVVNAQHGTLKLKKNGQIEYTPDNNYVGTDSFEYRVEEKFNPNSFTTATVNITVTESGGSGSSNSAPVAITDSFVLQKNTIYNETLLLNNDYDIDNDTIQVITIPTENVEHGTLTIGINGEVLYTPDPNFVGQDSFQYKIIDDQNNTSVLSAVVYISVHN